MFDYISRVKDLRTSILDTERRLKGQVDLHFLSDIDDLTSRSFYDGLPLEYNLQMKIDKYRPYTDAFAAAKAKNQKLDKQRYEGRYHTGQGFRDMKPIGSLLTHSTPQRSNYAPRYEAVTRSPASLNRNSTPRNIETSNINSGNIKYVCMYIYFL